MNQKFEMKNYIGTKAVKAKLTTRGAYIKLRGWKLPENEDPKEELYLVEYPVEKDTVPNHPDFKGYLTMSPKTVFEKYYKEAKGLSFGEALEALNSNKHVKVPEWGGYWFKESGMIKVMTADNVVLATPHFQQYIFRKDWEIVNS